GVKLPMNVSGLTGPITKLIFRFGGTSCSNAVGATGVGLTHSFVGDLVVKLTSPTGTTITLINKTGDDGNNFCQTVLDDNAIISIQGLDSSIAPFTGVFRPFTPLAAFNGENPN